jgi:hypothetical protein
LPGHEGLDIKAASNSKVFAVLGGKVSYTQNDPNSGNYGRHIWIDHLDGRSTHYAHLNRIDVSVGQTVSAGQQIGLAGSTGNSSGPHLHFDLNKPGQTYTDASGQVWPYNRFNPWYDLASLYKPDGRQLMTGWVYDPYLVKGSDGQAVNYSTNLSVRNGPGTAHAKIGMIAAASLIKMTTTVQDGYRLVEAWAVPETTAPVGVAMPPYFLPAVGDYGDICILKNSWGAGDERQQLQRQGNLSFVTKNQNWERRRLASGGIYLELDTSPNETEYYTIEGSPWLPLSWSVGDEYLRNETVKFYRKSDCQPSQAPYTVTNKIKFTALHSTWTSPAGIQLSNVIELHWLIAGGTEEKYWFAAGLGLVQWQNRSGRHSWVSEIVPIGQQQNNQMLTGCFGP